MKINYVIATWNGIRVKPVRNAYYYEQVLKNHLKILDGLSNSISQITIMKPKSGINNTYYDIKLSDKIKIVDCENKFQSYGQWLKAATLFLNDFDYFIFIEDDYVPAIDNFDSKLIELYQEGTYLCSRISVDNLTDPYCHCAISNGIISTETIKKVLKDFNYDIWLTNYGRTYPVNIFHGTNYQVAFSRYFLDNGILIKDYRNHYMVDYYYTNFNEFKDWSAPNVINKEKIFTPIQNIIK